MYIRWDYEQNLPIGRPCPYMPDDGIDTWLPLKIENPRNNRAQSLSFNKIGDIVFGEWIGPSDPLDVPLTNSEILDHAREILEYPLTTEDGNTFQFDADSERAMRKIFMYLEEYRDERISWRLLDNSTISVDGEALGRYLRELELLQAARAIIVDEQYMLYKNSFVTRRQIEAWKKSYLNT